MSGRGWGNSPHYRQGKLKKLFDGGQNSKADFVVLGEGGMLTPIIAMVARDERKSNSSIRGMGVPSLLWVRETHSCSIT